MNQCCESSWVSSSYSHRFILLWTSDCCCSVSGCDVWYSKKHFLFFCSETIYWLWFIIKRCEFISLLFNDVLLLTWTCSFNLDQQSYWFAHEDINVCKSSTGRALAVLLLNKRRRCKWFWAEWETSRVFCWCETELVSDLYLQLRVWLLKCGFNWWNCCSRNHRDTGWVSESRQLLQNDGLLQL